MSSRPVRRVAAVAVLLTAAIAIAATSPLIIGVGISNAILSISTNTLQKGWFSTSNALDRTKTDLRTDVSYGATTCSPAYASTAITSTVTGNFSAVTNSQGGVTGYTWDTQLDLASYQNHWYRHFHCDGSVEIHGCDQAIPISVTTTAYGRNNCHTYVNDSGLTVCVADTKTASLPAVQEADVTEICAVEESCGIGQCEKACQADCTAATYSGTAKQQQEQRVQCRNACECQCKIQVRTGTSCKIEEKCLE
jgi:hypothetical protein